MVKHYRPETCGGDLLRLKNCQPGKWRDKIDTEDKLQMSGRSGITTVIRGLDPRIFEATRTAGSSPAMTGQRGRTTQASVALG